MPAELALAGAGVVGVLVQAGVVVYWAGRLSARVEGLLAAVERLANRLDAHERRAVEGAD